MYNDKHLNLIINNQFQIYLDSLINLFLDLLYDPKVDEPRAIPHLHFPNPHLQYDVLNNYCVYVYHGDLNKLKNFYYQNGWSKLVLKILYLVFIWFVRFL